MLKPLIDQLMIQLSEPLKSYNFEINKGERLFFRNTIYGRDLYHITIINHRVEFDITSDFCVIYNALQKLLNETYTFVHKKDEKWTATVGAELGNASEGYQIRSTVYDEFSIPLVVSGLIDTFKEVALPCFQRFSSLEEILVVTAGDDLSSSIFCPLNDVRAKTAIAAAFLLKRRAIFDQLIKKKTLYLETGHPSQELDNFVAFANSLSKKWS